LLLHLAGSLRLQLLDARIGALECLILNQRRLHKRVGCVRRSSQSIGNKALGIRVAGIIFHFCQTIEQLIHKLLFLRGHGGSPASATAAYVGYRIA
jgi:hypothetical protein